MIFQLRNGYLAQMTERLHEISSNDFSALRRLFGADDRQLLDGYFAQMTERLYEISSNDISALRRAVWRR